MEVVPGLASLAARHGRLFVVVGVFDGLHVGHMYLIRHLRREARRRMARPAVVTFDAHPDEILLGSAPPLLCDTDERLVRLHRAGVEVTVVQHFDRALRETPYDEFIEMIRSRTDLAGLLMTPDAAFGYQRGGTPNAVADLGLRVEPPFDVVVVPPLELDGRPVRSAEIRSDVAAGELAGARRLLGRSLSVVGEASLETTDVRLSFPLPVALPPAGRYRVFVEPAWTEAPTPAWTEAPTPAWTEAPTTVPSTTASGPSRDATAGVARGRSIAETPGPARGGAAAVAAGADRWRATAVVEARGGLHLSSRDGIPAAPRLRVTFLSRLG